MRHKCAYARCLSERGNENWNLYRTYFSQIIPFIMNDLSIHTNFSSGTPIFTLVNNYHNHDPTNF